MSNGESGIFTLGFLIGVAIMFGFCIATGMADNHRFASRHDGLEDMVSEMRDECESAEGVIDCEWDEDKRDFVSK